ncbi:uncharacterized protein LOC131193072 [Ahaetulla prasina]|uniref:uncharacterized protein LOC131193072 n=1 Tax=Ahaetulla prasina TaxID=499056 RepID=UPI0026499683|nr:uncharacterized protein LOC131193072 [Ahaetulla prasina]
MRIPFIIVLNLYDREIRRGGGVAIFYKKSLNLKNIQVAHKLPFPETIVCDLSLNTTLRFLLCYRAPDYDITHANMLTSLLTWATSCPYPLIFLGDLNLPLINWITNECTTDPIHTTIHTTLYNAVTNLEQLVTNNTRLNNCLDLIFCNNPNSIYGLQIKEPFSNSDHCMIDFRPNIRPYSNHHNNNIPIYKFKKANYDLINNDLSFLDWQNLFANCITAEDHYRVFLLEINRIIKLYVPQMTTMIRKSKLPISIKKLQSKKYPSGKETKKAL